MDSIANSLAQTSISTRQAVLLLFLLAFVPLLLYVTSLIWAGRKVVLRPIRAFSTIRRVISGAAETGRPIHLSLGTGGIADSSTAESLAGVSVLQHVSSAATSNGAPLVVTMADATLLPLAQQAAFGVWANRAHRSGGPKPDVRLVAPDATAYASGTMDMMQHEPISGSVLIGRFGQEYLLMGEVGARRPAPLVAGAQSMDALPFIYATADEPLLGEEIYSSGAYLEGLPAHIASLRVQDLMRILVALAILAGVVLRSTNLWR